MTENISSTPAETAEPSEVQGSQTAAARNGISPTDVAGWRGSVVPDKIDSLMADAFNAEGEYVEADPYYDFEGDTTRIDRLSTQPAVLARMSIVWAGIGGPERPSTGPSFWSE